MKRSRHRRRARPLELPHERDRRAEIGTVKQVVIRQAARDLAAGLVDTDNYTRASGITDTAAKRRRLKS